MVAGRPQDIRGRADFLRQVRPCPNGLAGDDVLAADEKHRLVERHHAGAIARRDHLFVEAQAAILDPQHFLRQPAQRARPGGLGQHQHGQLPRRGGVLDGIVIGIGVFHGILGSRLGLLA